MLSFIQIRFIVGENWTNGGPTLLSLTFNCRNIAHVSMEKKGPVPYRRYATNKSHGLVFPQELFNAFCGCISSCFLSCRVCQASFPVAEVRRIWVIFFVYSYAGLLFVYLCDVLASPPLFVVRMCKCCLHSGTLSNSASKYSFNDKLHFQKLQISPPPL